jgi:mono/diheme cytochrome c family protein
VKRAVVLVALGMVGCKPAAGTQSTEGSQIFAGYCAQCHGPRGQPPADMVARFKVRDLTAPEFRAKLTPALVDKQVRNGSENKLMPAFSDKLSDQQITAIAQWVASPAFVEP